jgi:predicted nuclease of predicted toxin-antitoxin system
MAKFLANENVPADAVSAAQAAGIDLVWVRDTMPGVTDDVVLAAAAAVADNRVLVTFDKDFGDLVFDRGRTASPGVVLLRPRLRSPVFVAQFTVTVLSQPVAWEGNFCVAQEGRLRVVPLP